ncbi:MAG: hypothetical protein Kow0037_27170 [Calditrichia bacterium]
MKMNKAKSTFLIFIIALMMLLAVMISLSFSDGGGNPYSEYRVFTGETCIPPQGPCLWPPIIVEPPDSPE